jgi:4-hydroxy-tetrahydrodipicolinate synthase
MPRTPVITGVSPVLPTPFHADGALDGRSFARLAEHTWGLGVGSVMYPGFASEYASLTDAERYALLAALIASAPPGAAVVASVSDHATRVAAERAAAYADLGAAAVNLLPPHAGEPSQEAVLDHLATVLAAVAPLPVIVQYVPRETGTRLTPEELGGLGRAHGNLAAVKVECRSPGAYVRRLADLGLPGIAGNAGIDLPEALAAGAVGVQPGGGFTEVYADLQRAWDGGRRAAAVELHGRLAAHLERWWPHPGLSLAMGKAVAWRRGLIDGPYCRRPARTVPSGPGDPALAEVDRFIAEFGLGGAAPG